MEKLVWNQILKQSSRLLSQIDRDPDSPTYGSFDRNFWNYKIRDFSSAILQQGILALDVLYVYKIKNNIFKDSTVIKDLMKAGVVYWSKIQLKTGAFNEYYPNESGFPPTAFSLYSVNLVLKKYPDFRTEKITNAINRSISWLLRHPEHEALNQESTALAAIQIAQSIDGIVVNHNRFQKRLDKFYQSQNTEGWFNEYGGPDLGYLSVTIDSLWDIYLHSNDERALKAIKRAVDFIIQFISVSGETPVMINSRNTDYIVPYGITGYGSIDPTSAELSRIILKSIDKSDHMFNITDDRYLCHYIGQSYFRSLDLIPKLRKGDQLPKDKNYETYLSESKIYIKHINKEKSLFFALHKGGIYSIYNIEGITDVDYGWRYQTGNAVGVSHWQDKAYECTYKKNKGIIELGVRGYFSGHKYLRPSPSKHMGLRFLSFFIGNKLMKHLKKLIIFNKAKGKIQFKRTIKIFGDRYELNEEFLNVTNKSIRLYKAPHYSLRHVSSAGRFVTEELKIKQKTIDLEAGDSTTVIKETY